MSVNQQSIYLFKLTENALLLSKSASILSVRTDSVCSGSSHAMGPTCKTSASTGRQSSLRLTARSIHMCEQTCPAFSGEQL